MTNDDTGAPSDRLVALARAKGVATDFWDWRGRHTPISEATVVAVLAALDVDASSPEAVEAALAGLEDDTWRRVLPPVVVTREGTTPEVEVHVDHGEDLEVWVDLEEGGSRRLQHLDRPVEPRRVDGRLVGRATVVLPPDLPLGWHALRAVPAAGAETYAPLVVTPRRVGLPPAIADTRTWGLMVQLYSVRSQRSWGFGDLADLAELCSWGGRQLGAGFVLVNPLHAAEPVEPLEPSPYLPTTRRFANPVYLRVEDVRETAYLPAGQLAHLQALGREQQAANASGDLIDRDAVWAAKREALELVFAVPRTPAREAAFRAFREREGEGLEDFAAWCALAEHFAGLESGWPAEADDPSSPLVRELRARLAERVDFFAWLQWLLDEQLAAAQATAKASGMPVGVVHDLAVGVHPAGADTWALGDALASGVTVGAPPDAYNQQGQDWSQPPWRPDRLAELGYAPYRDMLRTVLRHAGGVRIDHVVGLFRLWWVPRGMGPREGAYVHYDHEALVGILALEAHRAGAFVVGEDLGTVEPWTRDYLRERGILGTSILWFERDGERPRAPQEWRELCLASVTTHDLPPTAGYLAGEHIDLRERLGLLERPVEEEREADRADQASVLGQLRALGLLADGAGEQETVEALHRFLVRTPARLVGVALPDVVGDRRAQNQPGTNREYPNWRVPLAGGDGRPVLLEDLVASERARSLARVVSGG